MLMVLSVNLRCDSGPIRVRFIIPCDIGLQDASQFNIAVNGTVLVKVVTPNVFYGISHLAMNRRWGGWEITVVSQRAHHADYETPGASGLGASTGSIVAVLPEKSGVFFMNADHVLNYNRLSTITDICPWLSSDQKP